MFFVVVNSYTRLRSLLWKEWKYKNVKKMKMMILLKGKKWLDFMVTLNAHKSSLSSAVKLKACSFLFLFCSTPSYKERDPKSVENSIDEIQEIGKLKVITRRSVFKRLIKIVLFVS